eukprot:3628121-Pyramimonas_sp.AAC.1
MFTDGGRFLFNMRPSPKRRSHSIEERTTCSKILMAHIPNMAFWHDAGLSGRNSYVGSWC